MIEFRKDVGFLMLMVWRDKADKGDYGIGQREMSEEMKKMRAQMEEDEQVASLMRGLRGQNLSDELFAAADTRLRLVEVGSFSHCALHDGLSQVISKIRSFQELPDSIIKGIFSMIHREVSLGLSWGSLHYWESFLYDVV